MITVTMLDTFTLRLTFPFSATTNATLKIVGAEWQKAGKFWTLPIGGLDRLIRHCGADLTAEPAVWLAASPKTPAMVRAENDAWAQRQHTPVQPVTPVTTDLEPTRFDQLLIDGLPRWAEREQQQQAMKARGRRWTR